MFLFGKGDLSVGDESRFQLQLFLFFVFRWCNDGFFLTAKIK